MKTVFADSFYYLAFVNERDVGHASAMAFANSFRGRTVTTEWVLTEVGDALSTPTLRPIFLELLRQIAVEPGLSIIPASHELFERGMELFSQRPDKSWSLTDCISFVVMEEIGLSEALTADHHFEQAGFVPLLA